MDFKATVSDYYSTYSSDQIGQIHSKVSIFLFGSTCRVCLVWDNHHGNHQQDLATSIHCLLAVIRTEVLLILEKEKKRSNISVFIVYKSSEIRMSGSML